MASGLVVSAAVAVGVWLALPAGATRLTILVAGRRALVRPGMTLAQAARLFALRARAGDLLDVDGRVLESGRYPGAVLLDGRPGSPAALVRSGDRVTVRDGRDRTEPRVRTAVGSTVDRRVDPQFCVDLVPARLVVVRGAVSHELVSARFAPNGRPFPERAVALTFDDGPFPYFTIRILAVLRRQHVPATFFVIGRNAAAYPALVRDEVAAGMAIGNHSYDHPNRPPFASLRRWRIRAEIRPGPRDWVRGTTARQIVRRVLAHVRAGSIVELHDGGGNRTATLRALPPIIAGIRRRGLTLVALASTG